VPLVRLTGIELRKTVDTRAGRWLLLAIAGLALAGLGWRLYNAHNTPVGFEHYFDTALVGVRMLLPVVGVLAMTTEWTQRTALTTFTLVPQRGRVVAAKLTAAVLLTVGIVLLVAALSAAASTIGGAVTGDVVNWGDLIPMLAGWLCANVLNVLMGAAFGAVLQQTALALIAFFVAPTLWAAVATPLFGDSARWLDVFSAFDAVSRLDLTGVGAQTAVALTVWVVLPLVAGVVRTLRREVS
jgi:hypothetical protein